MKRIALILVAAAVAIPSLAFAFPSERGLERRRDKKGAFYMKKDMKKGKRKHGLARFDFNKNGRLDPAEKQIMKSSRKGRRGRLFKRLDVDKSGTITRTEAASTRLAVRFDRIDANKDGVITRPELMAAKHGRKHVR